MLLNICDFLARLELNDFIEENDVGERNLSIVSLQKGFGDTNSDQPPSIRAHDERLPRNEFFPGVKAGHNTIRKLAVARAAGYPRADGALVYDQFQRPVSGEGRHGRGDLGSSRLAGRRTGNGRDQRREQGKIQGSSRRQRSPPIPVPGS